MRSLRHGHHPLRNGPGRGYGHGGRLPYGLALTGCARSRFGIRPDRSTRPLCSGCANAIGYSNHATCSIPSTPSVMTGSDGTVEGRSDGLGGEGGGEPPSPSSL